jgi:hypothetical protein
LRTCTLAVFDVVHASVTVIVTVVSAAIEPSIASTVNVKGAVAGTIGFGITPILLDVAV